LRYLADDKEFNYSQLEQNEKGLVALKRIAEVDVNEEYLL
jgi:hypothetical protein